MLRIRGWGKPNKDLFGIRNNTEQWTDVTDFATNF